MNKQNKQLITNIKEVLLSTGFEHTYILSVSHDENVIELQLLLPYHTDTEELQDVLNNLKEELNAHDVKIIKKAGKKVTILFGKKDLSHIDFQKELLQYDTLKINLPSAYGTTQLDFDDGASCHLLNGGTTRMGKTAFLLYLATTLYLQTKGNIRLYITSTKLKDFYPFISVSNCHLSRTDTELLLTLDELIDEYKHRDSLLYSKACEKATDSKSVKKLYPHMYKHFLPIFLIIDEYARFSENKEIQKRVQELVESAGYVNIHVVISTQRPDARTVLPPRIKSNLLARICFTTTDKNNSIVILDQEGAERLGKIQGRAIFLDSETNIVQIPYVTPEKSEEYLRPYKKESKANETTNNKNTERSNHQTLANKIQNLFEESTSTVNLPSERKPHQHDKPSDEKTSNGWFLLASTEGKR